MPVLRSRTFLLAIAAVLTAPHVTGAAGGAGPRRRCTLTGDDEAFPGEEISLRSGRRWHGAGAGAGVGPEPGDPAAAFRVATLDGEFAYQPGGAAGRGSVLIHAFTKHSGFLESMWSSEESLRSLLEELPDSAHLLCLSMDESAVTDALWMREQLHRAAASLHRKKEVLKRLHFSPLPLFSLGNWIPALLYYWSCSGHNCGLSQAVFTADGWKMPVVVKRLDARYDWLTARWGQRSYQLMEAGDGCQASEAVAGGVAWVSEGGCSFFTKVLNMARSNASGVLVYALAGRPIQDMDCQGAECMQQLSIPAAMVHLEPSVAQELRLGQQVNVSFQTTPSPNFFVGIDQQGALAEMGWFLYPSFSFVNWQAQWFDFYTELQSELQAPAQVVSIFDKAVMQGDKGAQATLQLPPGVLEMDRVQLDASLSCPGRRDASCAQWDHTVQLLVCCDRLSPYCGTELGRWITAFRRGIGRWQTDVSPLLPLLDGSSCTFTMKTVPWAMPWIVSLNLRFSSSNSTAEKLRPFRVMPLFGGGTFDKTYNKKHEPISFPVPASSRKVELYAVITGHGSDENGCGEFCVTSHHFIINAVHNNTRTFDTAGTALGCAERVREGAVPNEHGTWLYGRGGWCDGLQVAPWRLDVTSQLDMSGFGSNTVAYLGLFEGRDPDPKQQPGYIIMSSFLVFYK